MPRKKNAEIKNQEINETIVPDEQNIEVNKGDDFDMNKNDYDTDNVLNDNSDDMLELEKNDEFMREKCRIIGTNVRFQRKKRKFSIDNLADCIKLSSSYVGLLERGDRCPSLKCLLKLCELFDVTPNELLIEQIDKKQALKVSESTENNFYEAVVSLLHGLSEDELEYIANILKGLRKLNKKTDSADEPTEVVYGKKKKKQ